MRVGRSLYNYLLQKKCIFIVSFSRHRHTHTLRTRLSTRMTVTTNHTVTSASPQNWTLLDSNSSDRSKLEDLARSSFLRLMPIIVLCALLAVLGTIGNSLSVYIFLVRMRRNFLNDLFILLSGTSLLACAFCLPGEIFDLYNPYIYPSLTMCKIGRLVNLLISFIYYLMILNCFFLAMSKNITVDVEKKIPQKIKKNLPI